MGRLPENLPLILASASPRRSELLRAMGRDFTVVTAPTPESHDDHLTPREVCLLNAHRKARAVAKQHPDCLVLGADTIVCLGTRVFGKPKDMGDAEATLRALSGQTHEVLTGVSLIHHRLHREHLFADTTRVTFRLLGPGEIQAYLRKIQSLDKAGAYAIQEHGEMIVSHLDGSIHNVIGLPTEVLGRVLESW